MKIWQVDFYRRPLKDATGELLWELVVCSWDQEFEFSGFCRQSEANAAWLVAQFQSILQHHQRPELIQVFRPQALSLVEVAAQTLGIEVAATRRTKALKEVLQKRATAYLAQENYTGEAYHPTALNSPPPMPLPENLWGEQWRFAALPAGQIVEAFQDRPLPILALPEELFPINLGLASTVLVPGVVIDGGRQSMNLARWLQGAKPVALNYSPGAPDGLILEAGLVDRWVVATFEDSEVKTAARTYEQRKQLSQGLHFLLVRPDDSGMTYTGFWLLNSLY